jgi:hypothetical protein
MRIINGEEVVREPYIKGMADQGFFICFIADIRHPIDRHCLSAVMA